ncbi:neutral/alkaline non-lysosomal ceramidase N-terminal domain-containing protein [Pontibacter locisalis]|uniref:Neutral ceramidase n=1 Tax=Pontibacter locisalis TaxID=1719035 RepID=A0ABW5IQK0_9BACT
MSCVKNLLKRLFLLFCILLLCQGCIVQKLDDTPFRKTAYFHKTQEQINQFSVSNTVGDTLQVGWAKVNITPPVGTPLAGYGKRRGMRYAAVHDSAWVRTFAFDNGTNKAYFVSLDMLIAPMSVAAELERQYAKSGIKPEQVYLSATHTHTSFGGWGKKMAGRIMAGKYDKKLVTQTAQHIIKSIEQARADLRPAKIGYGSANGAAFVRNRLTGTQAERDTTIRFLKFARPDGSRAILCTFSAHPTILPSMQPVLSGDYPGILVQELETVYDFAAFSAGAVGSHSSVYNEGSFESVAEVGQSIASTIVEEALNVQTAYTSSLLSSRVPLYLPDPQWRVGEDKKLSPALFYTFFGRYDTYINRLQIGNTILLGVPADFSGELVPALEAQAHQQNSNLMLTGFNGSYMGYVIPDKHYQLKKYEARAMNFYGPYSGSYMSYILSLILDKSLP